MKNLLHTFTTLWRQAPLWRFCSIIGVGSLLLAAFFPTASLKQLVPWLPGTPPAISHTDNNTDAAAQGDNSPDATGNVPFRLQYPDLTASLQNTITLAGHIFPLPKGEWHPVLAAQITDSSPFSFLTLIRTDHGAITGMVIAQATQQAVPLLQVSSLTNACHDDRNYFNNAPPTSPTQDDCAALGLALLHGDILSSNPFINESIARLRATGFPVPPLLISAIWRHVESTADGKAQAGSMDVLIPPLDPTTHQMLAPTEAWRKDTLASHPIARNFISKARHWLPHWQTALRLGFNNRLDEASLPPQILQDPEAP